ncbi:MAG TPA: diguanylate cyclase [Longimicrobiaceae bacterium]|nr:diguanylate cyclase [Longimicrobiaceae bacterium]
MSRSSTVYVTDDNPAILQGLDRALNANGYRVCTADSGPRLLDLLAGAPAPPDLLLLDVMMPEMSGLEVLRSLRRDSRWTDLPVVLITATNDATLPVSALRDGAVDFLTKPFRLDELLARVDSHIQRHQELRRAREQARIRLQAIDLIRELNRVATADEMFHLVTSRTAEILEVGRCSVVVVERGEHGEAVARVAASSDGAVEGKTLELDDHPEVRAALERNAPVCVADVASSPLFAEARARRELDGPESDVHSVVAVPFPITSGLTGVFLEHARAGEPALGEGAEELAGRVVEALVQACGRVQAFQNLIEQRRRLHDLAHTDELTGCATRRSLLTFLREEMELATTRQEPLSILLMDVDRFKEINDTYGHLAGDAVLRALGAWLHAEGALRSHDLAGRYGGDEFVVVLPQTPAAGALRFAERARSHFAAVPFTFDAAPVLVTLSVGVASWPDVDARDAEELLSAADAALYAAKQAGRDQVHLAASAPLPHLAAG